MAPFLLSVKSGAVCIQGTPSSLTTSGARIIVLSEEVIVEVPFPSAEFLFYRHSVDSFEISNDLRLLYQPNCEVSTSGLFSLLQFGAVVPPLTLFRSILSFVPGFTYRINIHDLTFTKQCSIEWSATQPGDECLGDDAQVSRLSDAIKAILINACRDQEPIILFSGGVDSGILAAEAARMGWKGTQLVHYSFGSDNSETCLAEAMARHLGLRCEVVRGPQNGSYDVLDRAAYIYPFPYCDYSCLHTYELAQSVVRECGTSHIVLDGTGADADFGLFTRAQLWDRLYRIPTVIRATIAALYGPFSMWRQSSRLEYYVRLLKRSASFPSVGSSVAQHPLLGIGLMASDADIACTSHALVEWLSSISPSQQAGCLVPLADIGLVCSGIFAQKVRPVLMEGGFTVKFPYLEQRLVDLALQHGRLWPRITSIRKYALKRLLGCYLPAEMVYRKKRPFVLTVPEQFSDPRFIQRLEAVLDLHSAVLDVVDRRFVEGLIEPVRSKLPLADQTYNYMWAIAFVNCWLMQLQQASQILQQQLPSARPVWAARHGVSA